MSARRDEDSSLEDSAKRLECAICLQTCIHPVRLPCRHIFCYLCVKGIANQSKKCAMCRQEIPPDYLDRPDMVDATDVEGDVIFEDGSQWFYEGRNGWWQYDDRTSIEIENSFTKGDDRCEVLVAGFLYIIDFQDMVQMRRNDPSRRRRIKRDVASISKKGVAGIRFSSTEQLDQVNPPLTGASNESSTTIDHLKTFSSTVPATPSNTPQTPNLPVGDHDTSVPSSPGRNSAFTSTDSSLVVEALNSLRLNSVVSTGNDLNRFRTRLHPAYDVDLNYSEEEEV